MRILLELGILIATVLIIIFSAFVISHKSMIYSALFLAFLGLANASLFFALGYPLVAFVQVVVYVGASVLFLIISVSLLKEPKYWATNKLYPIAGILGVISVGLIFIYVFGAAANIHPSITSYLSTASQILSVGDYAVVLLFLLLVLSMVISVTVSLGGEKK